MTAGFGPVAQIGYVVRDIEKAMAHWVTVVGVGPFVYSPKVTFPSITYKGGDASSIQTAVAHAFSGDLDIELIQQTCDTPSIYLDFLAEHREGMQHLGILVEDMDAGLAKAARLGWNAAQAGRTHQGVRFAYFDNAGPHAGTMIELIEKTQAIDALFNRAKTAARGWDGRTIHIPR